MTSSNSYYQFGEMPTTLVDLIRKTPNQVL